jgi:hypothetical protein
MTPEKERGCYCVFKCKAKKDSTRVVHIMSTRNNLFETSKNDKEWLKNESELTLELGFKSFGKQILEEIDLIGIDGVAIFDHQLKLVYSNNLGHLILEQLSQFSSLDKGIPEEIQSICKWMHECRICFHQQKWVMSFKIVITPLKLFQVHAKWIKIKTAPEDFLLLRMEDQNQFFRDAAIEEAKRYGFTIREQEVWLLHRQGYTYKEIAQKLDITPNTVKKHMKSILSKQREG